MMIPVNILINDKTVIDDLESCSIKMDGGFCNSLDLSLKSQKFWNECDPTTDFGELKLKVVIGITTYEFLCEERSSSVSKDGLGFTVWGRAKQALLSNPYSKTISDTEDTTHPWQTGVTTAEDIVDYVVSSYCPYSVTVNWNITDFSIYEDSFSVSNQSPIEIISALANIVGAELKAHNDGSLSIETYSVAEETTVATYTDLDDIVELNENIEYSSGFNAVTIHGYDSAETAASTSAHISIESITDSPIVPGGTQTVRVYYYHFEGLTPVCYGDVCLPTNSGTEQITEDIQLIWGHGNTSKPDTNGETEVTGDEDTPLEIKSVTYRVNYQEYCLRPSSAEDDYYFFFYFSDQSAYSIHTLTVAEPDEPDSDLCSSIVVEKQSTETVYPGSAINIYVYGKYTPKRGFNSAGSSVVRIGGSEMIKAEDVVFTNGVANLSYPLSRFINDSRNFCIKYQDGSTKLIIERFIDDDEHYSVYDTIYYRTDYNVYRTSVPSSWAQSMFNIWFTFNSCAIKSLQEAAEEIPPSVPIDLRTEEKDITINVKDYVAEINVENASVYIDGRYEGRTDEAGLLNVNNVAVGDHTIKIVASDYLTSDLDDLANDNFTVS